MSFCHAFTLHFYIHERKLFVLRSNNGTTHAHPFPLSFLFSISLFSNSVPSTFTYYIHSMAFHFVTFVEMISSFFPPSFSSCAAFPPGSLSKRGNVVRRLFLMVIVAFGSLSKRNSRVHYFPRPGLWETFMSAFLLFSFHEGKPNSNSNIHTFIVCFARE